jgi:hypothetical protein
LYFAAKEEKETGHFLCFRRWAKKVVLLRIPVFRDRDFRIFKPILKKGFDSDPDPSDPNPQIPQKRSVTIVTKYALGIIAQMALQTLIRKKLCQKSPKFAKFRLILGPFYLATKIRILALKILIFFLSQKRTKESDL